MLATIIDIADATVSQIQSAAVTLDIDPANVARIYIPQWDLEDLGELRISVVPRVMEFMPLDRATNKLHGIIDVAVQKKCSGRDESLIDPLVTLVEQIADLFRLKRLDAFVAARCVKVEQAVLVSQEHWQELNLFTSLITLTFETAR